MTRNENGLHVANRKTATALRLVNWSRFQDETIRMDGSTLITGVNGTGKSTILDAMSYLLTGNRQFNKAANDRDRTVLSYVRGDTRSEGENRYLRSGEVTSYVLMEFWSPADEEYLTAGVCVESPDAHNCKTGAWFLLRHTRLKDVETGYREGGTVHVHTRTNLLVHGKRLKSSEFRGMEAGTERILRALGVRASTAKYRSGLLKMMAFRPENNIDQFIQDSVLDPGSVNSLEEIRTQRAQFDEIRDFYSQLQEGKKELEELESLTQEYEKRDHRLEIRTLMQFYQLVPMTRSQIRRLENERRETESRLASLEGQMEEAGRELERARERLSAAESENGYQEFRQSLGVLTEQERECARLTEEKKRQVKELESLVRGLLEVFAWAPVSKEDQNVLLSAAKAEYAAEDKAAAFRRLAEEERNWEAQENRTAVHLEDDLKAAEKRQQELSDEIRRLKANRIVYPAEMVTARDLVKKELEAQGIHTEVRFFAELVSEIKDLKWRRAIETFLGNKRFNLIVDGKYCMQAAEILRTRKIYNTRVVITDRLPETEVMEGSAAEVLEIPNRFARLYANYLLNGIHLCHSMEELHDYPKGALLEDGTLAKGYAVSLMNMNRIRLCMGQDVVKVQLAGAEKEFGSVRKEIAELGEKRRACASALASLKKIRWREDAYSFDAPERLKELRARAKELKEDIREIRNNPDFMQALKEQEKARDIYRKAQKKSEDLVTRKAALEQDKKAAGASLKEKKADLSHAEEEYAEALRGHELIEQEMKAEYEKAASPERPEVVTYKNLNHTRNLREDAMNAMLRQQAEYCRTAGIDNSHTGISFIRFFRDQYKEIATVRIEEVKNQLASKSKELESAFMIDFVGELNESIQKARDEIDIINEELRQIPFGQDTYRFKMEPRADRGTFFQIQRKLRDYMENPEVYMNSNRDDEEMEQYIRDFMDRILSEEDESEYTDYRKYFTYDMEITSHEGVSVARANLSKKQGSASNGEKQTPYFIILAASLMQFYPRDSICERLAFIDEAFSALSQERIEQMVRYLEENHFQVIYAAPPEKIGSIGEHVSTTVTLALAGRYTKPVEGMIEEESA